jgi:hypothetical protein
VAGVVKVYTVSPTRTLQGVDAEQFAPLVRTVFGVVIVTARSPSMDAIPAPPLPPPPLSSVNTLVAVHPYRFCPAGAVRR